MDDYMHHPTSFGHQLYYLNLAPLLIKSQTSNIELLQLTYPTTKSN